MSNKTLVFRKDQSIMYVYFDLANEIVISKIDTKNQLSMPLKTNEILDYLDYLKAQGWIKEN